MREIFGVDLYWKDENKREDGEYWIGEEKCRCYSNVSKIGLDYGGYDLNGLELLFVPEKFEEAVISDNLKQFSGAEIQGYGKFIDAHTFYFNSREMLNDWYCDYQAGALNEDGYYLTKHATRYIHHSMSIPVHCYHFVCDYLLNELHQFKRYISGLGGHIKQEDE